MQQMAAASPDQPVVQPCPKAKTWIELHLVDRDNNPIPSKPYKIKLPDGSVLDGTLDAQGKARHEGIAPGTASICFVDLDGREWVHQ